MVENIINYVLIKEAELYMFIMLSRDSKCHPIVFCSNSNTVSLVYQGFKTKRFYCTNNFNLSESHIQELNVKLL